MFPVQDRCHPPVEVRRHRRLAFEVEGKLELGSIHDCDSRSGPLKIVSDDSLFGIVTAANHAILAGPGASRTSSVAHDSPAIASPFQQQSGLSAKSGMEEAMVSTVCFCDASSVAMASDVDDDELETTAAGAGGGGVQDDAGVAGATAAGAGGAQEVVAVAGGGAAGGTAGGAEGCPQSANGGGLAPSE